MLAYALASASGSESRGSYVELGYLSPARVLRLSSSTSLRRAPLKLGVIVIMSVLLSAPSRRVGRGGCRCCRRGEAGDDALGDLVDELGGDLADELSEHLALGAGALVGRGLGALDDG